MRTLQRLLWLLLAALGWQAAANAQSITETLVGSMPGVGPNLTAPIVSRQSDKYAVREREGQRERYVSTDGSGPWHDRLLPGAVWIGTRLVYYAKTGSTFYLVDGARQIALPGAPVSPVGAGRPWSSTDGRHYAAFASNGKKISWYFDGKKQAARFDKLDFVKISGGGGLAGFVARKGCAPAAIGFGPGSAGSWGMIREVSASADGTITFVYGERANSPYLERNGKTVLAETIEALHTSVQRDKWYAVVDRSVEGAPSVVLLENGKEAARADRAPMDQQFFLAANGATWAWQLNDADYIAVTIKQPGRPDLRLPSIPSEFQFSDDGAHQAYFLASVQAPGKVDLVIDGKLVATSTARAGSFRFGPANAYAYAAVDGAEVWVQGSAGSGPRFTDVSKILFLPDGRAAYIGWKGNEAFAVIGASVMKLNADSLSVLDSLRVDGAQLKLIGKRGKEVYVFAAG